MRILVVAPQYDRGTVGAGRRVGGQLTRLARRGHHVEVGVSADRVDVPDVTTVDEDGVRVHRLRPRVLRDDRLYRPMLRRVSDATGPIAFPVERDWMRLHGPDVPALVEWLPERTGDVDVVVFVAYDAATTFDGLHAVTGLVPTVLHPLATASPVLGLSIFDQMLRSVDAFAFRDDEERRLIDARMGVGRRSVVVGAGIDVDAPAVPARDVDAFRSRFGLDDAPYLLGIDGGGGREAVVAMFDACRARRGADVGFVVVGSGATDSHEGVVATGPLDDTSRAAALAGCLALVEPTHDEHTVARLLDAWSAGRPVLVDGRVSALDRLVRDTGGGLPFTGFAEFEAAVDLLVEGPAAAAALGDAGRRHAQARYRWEDVLGRYEWFLEDLVVQWRSSTASSRLSTG
jgi:glycosyltransferase involved in cell wall biosynthesis